MSRLHITDPATVTDPRAELFAAVSKRLGRVPNGYKAIGNSSAALSADLHWNVELGQGNLAAAERERIALLTANINGCGYCLSAHNAGSRAIKISQEEIDAAKHGRSAEPRSAAILAFARAVTLGRGHVADEVLAAARDSGLTDAELVEIVAVLAVNTFENYINIITQTPNDFPVAVSPEPLHD
jgi:uncharacterized peroxidase-related enzyme